MAKAMTSSATAYRQELAKGLRAMASQFDTEARRLNREVSANAPVVLPPTRKAHTEALRTAALLRNAAEVLSR